MLKYFHDRMRFLRASRMPPRERRFLHRTEHVHASLRLAVKALLHSVQTLYVTAPGPYPFWPMSILPGSSLALSVTASLSHLSRRRAFVKGCAGAEIGRSAIICSNLDGLFRSYRVRKGQLESRAGQERSFPSQYRVFDRRR